MGQFAEELPLLGSLVDNYAPRMASGAGDVWLTKYLGTFDWVSAPDPTKPATQPSGQ